jgi:hypothetical protein
MLACCSFAHVISAQAKLEREFFSALWVFKLFLKKPKPIKITMFSDLTTESLKYLTLYQILEDIRTIIDGQTGRAPTAKTIVVGSGLGGWSF